MYQIRYIDPVSNQILGEELDITLNELIATLARDVSRIGDLYEHTNTRFTYFFTPDDFVHPCKLVIWTDTYVEGDAVIQAIAYLKIAFRDLQAWRSLSGQVGQVVQLVCESVDRTCTNSSPEERHLRNCLMKAVCDMPNDISLAEAMSNEDLVALIELALTSNQRPYNALRMMYTA